MPAANINGTVIQLEKDKPRGKCRKWKLVICLGYDPITKKYPQKARRFTGTYTEAQEALKAFVAEISSNTESKPQSAKDYTFSEYVEIFMDLREKSGKVAVGTTKRERDKFKSLAYLIGDMKIKDITPKILDAAYQDLRSGKSRSGRRLSGTYISDIHKKVTLLMRDAAKKGYVSKDPCLTLEKPQEDTKEKRALHGTRVQKLLASLNPCEHMECGVMLCTILGLRRGEAVGLSWGDVDFDNKTIHISHSYDDAGNLSKPKTKAGNRRLPLSDPLVSALKRRYDTQIVLMRNYAPDLLHTTENGSVLLKPETPIIADILGNRIHPSGLGHWWYNHRAGYGLNGWTLHELRHTFLTLAAEKNVHPSVMQKLAGHSTSRLSMDIYTHVNMDAQREAMESMQDIFGLTA